MTNVYKEVNTSYFNVFIAHLPHYCVKIPEKKVLKKQMNYFGSQLY